MDGEHHPERFYIPQGSHVGQKAPDVLRHEHEKFKKRFSRALKGSLGLASNKKEFEQRILKTGELQGGSLKLGEIAAAEFTDALGSVDKYKQQRTNGVGGASAAFQDSLFAVARFAAAYSGVLEAVSKASGPYTEIGYQTMTILLIVFVNKKKNDDKIISHLDRIQRILPRLETWKGIYRNDKMHTWVSEIYHKVMEFSRAVTVYFCRRRTRYWLAANPLSMDSRFDDIAHSIYSALTEVNTEANQNLHARSKRIEQHLLESKAKNAELEKKLDDLRSQLEERDKQADDEKFQLLEEGLSSKAAFNFQSCFNLSGAKTVLKKAFPNVKECSSAIDWSMYTHMTPDRILSHTCFREWADLEDSALLVIHGGTKREGRASTIAMPCWLSPAAIHITEHLADSESSGTTRDRIIYFSCRPDNKTSIEQASDVLTMVALRLLGTRKDILRDRLRDFERMIPPSSPISSRPSSPSWSRTSFSSSPSKPLFSPGLAQRSMSAPVVTMAEHDHYDPCGSPNPFSISKPATALQQSRIFLNHVLEELSKKDAQPLQDSKQNRLTACIVMDRLDYIGDNVELKKLLRELTALTKEKDTFRLKIVVVAEARLDNDWRNGLPQEDRDHIFDLKMDQRELTTVEMARQKQQVLWKD